VLGKSQNHKAAHTGDSVWVRTEGGREGGKEGGKEGGRKGRGEGGKEEGRGRETEMNKQCDMS